VDVAPDVVERCRLAQSVPPFNRSDPAVQSGFRLRHRNAFAPSSLMVPGARHAQDLALADLISAAEDIRVALEAHGWKHWARRMMRAIHPTDPANSQAEQTGQTLETLRASDLQVSSPTPNLTCSSHRSADSGPRRRRSRRARGPSWSPLGIPGVNYAPVQHNMIAVVIATSARGKPPTNRAGIPCTSTRSTL
jgi:hypothetical protein